MGSGEQAPSGGPVGTVRMDAAQDAVLVTLTGEIDGDLHEELGAMLATIGELGLPVQVDETEVTFMDSSGATFLSQRYLQGPLMVAASSSVAFQLKVLAMDEVLVGPQV